MDRLPLPSGITQDPGSPQMVVIEVAAQ